jgi:hypothetical protein
MDESPSSLGHRHPSGSWDLALTARSSRDPGFRWDDDFKGHPFFRLGYASGNQTSFRVVSAAAGMAFAAMTDQ